MLEKIDDYKKKLDMFRPLGEELLPEIKAYYRVGLAYSSTALEGFSYTESETKILLEEGLTVGGKPLRDALAITGHAKAYDAMFSLLHEHVLTNDNILEMHALLEGGLENGIAGVYRKKQIFVTGTPFVFPKADTVPVLMEAFECWMREYRRKLHPVEGSYTNFLLRHGQDKILKKLGEEAVETIIASKNNDKKEILYEMGDLWYHCLVALAYHNIAPDELLNELVGRRSGGEYHKFIDPDDLDPEE